MIPARINFQTRYPDAIIRTNQAGKPVPSRIPGNYLILIGCFSAVKLAIHFLTNGNYGFYGDELYYISLSKHLQAGYLESGPFIELIAWMSALFFGKSLFAYRFIPTVCSALTVFLTGAMAYYLGGKKLAISIACTAVICSPAYLATSYLLQPVVFEHLFWTAGMFLIIRFIQTSKQVFIYACAIVVGIGILNKYTIVIYALAAFAGILLQKNRHSLSVNWIPAVLLCATIVSFNVIWQIMHGVPLIRYLSIVNNDIVFKGTADYTIQFLFFHGAGIAVWLAGLGYLYFYQPASVYGFAASAFLLTSIAIIFLHGKIYYGLGAFPVLFAAGGVCWEKILHRVKTAWLCVFFSMLIMPALIALPVVVPVFPFSLMLQYCKLMTTYTAITQPLRWEDGRTHEITQAYAAMFGWDELNKKTEAALVLLNEQQKSNTVILTESYGIAGAESFFEKDKTVPVISPDNSFILWSPENLISDYVIYISSKTSADIAGLAEQYTLTGTIQNEFAQISGMNIYLLYKPSARLKRYYELQRSRFVGQ